MRNKIYLDRESLQLLLEKNPELEVAFTQCAENWIKDHILPPSNLADVQKTVNKQNKLIIDEVETRFNELKNWTSWKLDDKFKQDIKDKINVSLNTHIMAQVELKINDVINNELNITRDSVSNIINELIKYAKTNIDKYLTEDMVKRMLSDVLKEKFGLILN